MTRFVFTITANEGAARTGTISLERGVVRTPPEPHPSYVGRGL